MNETIPIFAAAAPGLEPQVADELRALGIRGVPEAGGVAWAGTMDDVHAANLWLRTATRVTLGAAEFRARTFFELERHARKVPWERWVAKGGGVRLRVTSRKSKLYHEGAIAERVLDAIDRRVGGLGEAGVAGEEDEDTGSGQLFVVRFVRDACVVRADTSGALLHLRGYRQALARAPLRETLAAALLRASGWPGDAPLVDPMCGSGTIAIEGALMARGIAPALAGADREPRRFAFQSWPDADAAAWARAVERARDAIRPAAPAPILASDRDAGAVQAATSNAERAGVLDDLELRNAPVSAFDAPPGPGWIVSNPPYGVRVGETEALRNLYAALGRVARERAPGWTLALLSAEPRLEAQVGVRFEEALATRNGGIPVRVVVGKT
jgi:putative N6-adenine-specific DNA methylase